MPNPKRRHSKSRGGKRRGGHTKVKVSSLSACSNCGSLKTLHTVCEACGYYKGAPVLKIKEKSKKE